MKSVFDASFRYSPSYDTDLRRTFERLRRERQALARRLTERALERRPLRAVRQDAVEPVSSARSASAITAAGG